MAAQAGGTQGAVLGDMWVSLEENEKPMGSGRRFDFIFAKLAAFDPPATLRVAMRAGREKMLLHVFRAESGALAERRGERPGGAIAAGASETGSRI